MESQEFLDSLDSSKQHVVAPTPKKLLPEATRDLRAKKHCDEQLKLYTLCTCGSGKKFKWCCKGKTMFTLNTDNM